jgi:RsiW-degrading membrane proteinase PrsW (M82 family)
VNEVIKTTISLLPVCAFLLALIFMDSFKLVSPKSVFRTILAGAIVAVVCYIANRLLMDSSGLDTTQYTRYVSPVIEETTKMFFLIYLFKKKQIGFMVDAAIHGFAIGTGFALVENLYYLSSIESSNILIWVVRGFGTAAMHGATMAMFGIISKSFIDRIGRESLSAFLPGLIVAVAVHSLFNHFIFSPLLMTAIVIVLLPTSLLAVFERSERATRKWLGIGFDADQELLHSMISGEFFDTRVGKYLQSLQDRFPGAIVADMFCLLRIHTELALKAKGSLMLREAGVKAKLDEETRAKFEEMSFLEKSIGKTGRLAIAPFLYKSSRDLWQLHSIKS